MVRLMMGDVDEVLSEHIPDESIQMVVTSPPYWGLRDYGVDGQIGHEPTVQAYVERLVKTFGEVRRVLRGDGTFWLNLGDSFSTTDGSFGRSDPKSQKSNAFKLGQYYRTGKFSASSGLPPKNLLLVPYRVASAMQADGWTLRQDIIWHRQSCLPEPVKDRPSSVHEHLFLFAKSQHYYYDKQASGTLDRFPDLLEKDGNYQRSVWVGTSGSSGMNFCKTCFRTYHADEYKRLAHAGKFGTHDASQNKAQGLYRAEALAIHHASELKMCGLYEKRAQSKRDAFVGKQRHWKTGAEAAPLLHNRQPKVCSSCGGCDWEGHAAPYPEKLVAPCIMSGTSDKGACVNCGTCWIRDGKSWKKNCSCKTNEVRPCVVLDCFNGSGTTGVVAMRLGRSYLGIDLSPMYTGAAYERLARVAKMRGIEL
jgi:DNA modification methylase